MNQSHKQFNRVFTLEEMTKYNELIGKKVWKKYKSISETEPKPFKSGNKINTATGIVSHFITGYPSFIFVEDDSMVECFRCSSPPDNVNTK